MVINVQLKNRTNMKKTYINPELVIVKMAAHQHVLTASNPNVLLDSNESVDAGSVESRGDFFDFDEDEGF
jgi:hypothetical protein